MSDPNKEKGRIKPWNEVSKKKVHIYDHHRPYDEAAKERPGEQVYGKDTLERVAAIGASARFFRDLGGYTNPNPEQQEFFNRVLHQLGKNLMEQRISETRELEEQQLELKRKKLKFGRIMRKNVEVFEDEDGGVSIALDRNWDTSNWSNEMIEAGCEFIILMFSDPLPTIDKHRKERLSLMMSKLLDRHEVAIEYVRRNIEALIAKAANRSIRGGKVAGILDLLYVISLSKQKYTTELSRYSMVQKLVEMLTLEMRLASIIIQHTYRAMKDKKRVRYYHPSTEGFGSLEELQVMRDYAITIRTAELKGKWKTMHWVLPEEVRKQRGGQRGPVYMGAEYLLLSLQIIEYLVSNDTKEYACSNREDVLKSNGCILLAGFLADPTGKFADLSLRILALCSNCGESLPHMMHAGIVPAVWTYYKYLKKVVAPLFKRAEMKLGRAEERELNTIFDYWKSQVIQTSLLISRLATHASGIYRARSGYRYYRSAITADTEDIDYSVLLQNYGKLVTEKDTLRLLGNMNMILEIFDTINYTTHLNTMRGMLNCILALSCSDCHDAVLKGIIANGARSLISILNLLEEQDPSVHALALSIFVQLNTLQAGRKQLFSVEITKYLAPWLKSHQQYHRKPYQRAILVAASLCRCDEWRAYDPVEIYHHLKDINFVRVNILLDFLRTIKSPPLTTSETLTIPDLVVWPRNTSKNNSLEFSQVANKIGAYHLTDYLTHPHEEKYFQSLPWEESTAICVILEALSTDVATAGTMFSSGTIRFIGNCIFLAKFIFLGPPMLESFMLLILSGVTAAANALSNLCAAGIVDKEKAFIIMEGFKKSDMLESACFFVNTLGINHPSIDATMKRHQKQVGESIIRFFNAYSDMVLAAFNGKDNEELHALKPAGQAICNLIRNVKNVHGKGSEMIELLDTLCRKLCNLTSAVAIAQEAMQYWKITDALHVHLPSPLSSLGICSVDDTVFKMGLGALPATFFQLCCNLCQTESGKQHVIADGYLRRSLENIVFLFPFLENNDTIKIWKEQKKSNRQLNPAPSAVRKKIVACLRVIEKCCNYNSSVYGSGNDIILFGQYSIIDHLVGIITQYECPRDDEAVVAATLVLGKLAEDTVRLGDLYEKKNILELVQKQFSYVDDQPIPAIKACIEVVKYMAAGVRNNYLSEHLPQMRKQLFMVARVHPSLAPQTRDAQWYITRLTASTNRMIKNGELSTKVDSSVDEDDDEGHLWGGHGSHEVCGVSSCGSLRLDQSFSHGSHIDMTDDDHENELLTLRSKDEESLAVSRLSAREKELRDRVQMKKSKEGFLKEQKYNPMNDPRISKSSHSSRTKMRSSTVSSLPIIPTSPIANKFKYSVSPIKALHIDDVPELILTKPPPNLTASLKLAKSKMNTGLF